MDPHVVIAAGATLETAFLPARLLALRADFRIQLTVALSQEACAFVTPTALRGVTGNAPYVENTSWDDQGRPQHLALARCDLLVMAPATARIVADGAAGRISGAPTRLLAFTPWSSVLIAPALHPDLDRAIYEPHLTRLETLGCRIVPSDDLFASWADTRSAIEERLAAHRRVPRSGPIRVDEL